MVFVLGICSSCSIPYGLELLRGKGHCGSTAIRRMGFCNGLKPFLAINVFIFELKKEKKNPKSEVVLPKFSMFLLLLFP